MKTVCLCALLLSVAVCVLAEESTNSSNRTNSSNLFVVLSLDPAVPKPGDSVRLNVEVENKGEHAVRFIRLHGRCLEVQGGKFFGWTIKITGPGGAYQFLALPSGPYYFSDDDLIVLWPGESVGTKIELSSPYMIHGEKRLDRGLRDVEGQFSVEISYKASKDYLATPNITLPQEKRDTIFLGPLFQKLTFSLKKGN